MSMTPEVHAGGRGLPAAEVYRNLRLVIFDVDGVLTDGTIAIDARGVETKFFNVRDGSGMAFLNHAGLPMALLTGRSSPAVDVRARELSIPPERVVQGAKHKRPAFERLLAACGVDRAQTAFIGDDIVDVPVLQQVALAACPADARPEAVAACHLVTTAPGGHGAVRQLCEHILRQRGGDEWDRALRKYFGETP
jgi:3-deoxy-D-manno-octulosonate 8-phosphate phosphatase (KDO 8-P phosphatase)